jgi:hypothetical protein
MNCKIDQSHETIPYKAVEKTVKIKYVEGATTSTSTVL